MTVKVAIGVRYESTKVVSSYQREVALEEAWFSCIIVAKIVGFDYGLHSP